MATIKCKACGRTYNYRNSELCPKCGAFNRPPRRMRVGFDSSGSVELQTEKEFARNARAAGPDDVCFEEQARKVRSSDTLISSETLDQLGDHLNKWGNRVEKWWTENSGVNRHAAKDSPLRDRKKGKSSGGKAVAIVAAVSILVSLLGTIMESCESNRIQIAPDYPSASTEQVAPSEVYWSEEHYQAILDSWSVSQEVALSEVFEWSESKYWVGDWQLTGGGNGDNVMIVAVNGNEFPEEKLNDCFLLWVDWDGTEWTYAPEKFQNGALIFRYLHTTTIPEGALCWLMFNDFDDSGNWRGTTAVSLVGRDAYFSDGSQDSASTELWSEEVRKEKLDRYGVTEVYGMGSDFMWQWQNVGVNGWEVNENNGDRFMELSVEVDSELIERALIDWYMLWVDSDGNEWVYYPSAYRDGKLVFTNLHTTIIDENTPIWLLCEQYEDSDDVRQYLWTTAVELN